VTFESYHVTSLVLQKKKKKSQSDLVGSIYLTNSFQINVKAEIEFV